MTTVTGGPAAAPTPGGVDSGYAWYRLAVSLLIATIGGVGLWSVVVTLPAVEMDFEVARADASLPYTATLIGFALGGILMGRLADRFGILVPLRGRRGDAGGGLCALRPGNGTLAVHRRPGRAGRAPRQFLHLRADPLRHLAMVPAPARHRRRHRRQRQLSRRHRLAAGGAAADRSARLARYLSHHRRGLPRHPAAAFRPVAPAAARRGGAGHRGAGRSGGGGRNGDVRSGGAGGRGGQGTPLDVRSPVGSPVGAFISGRPADAADHRRSRLLHRHGHAAGACRRLLRRSRLWHGQGRGDAVADAGGGDLEPARFRLHRRPDRRAADPARLLRPAMPVAAFVPAL